MVKKTSSGVFTTADDMPYQISRGYSRSDSPSTLRKSTSQPQHSLPPTKVSPEKYTRPFLEFMTDNPTSFHAVNHFETQLIEHGYVKLSEPETWVGKVKPGGKYYTTRNGSALIAFAVGHEYKPGGGIGMIAGHIDALTVKLKPISKLPNKAGYVQLGVAPYAGALNPTWWDRDLGIGGRVLTRESETGKIKSELVRFDMPVARIPTLAPHLGAAAAGPFNKETQMVPIIGIDNSDISNQASSIEPATLSPGSFAATQPDRLVKAIAQKLGVEDYNAIIGWELELYDSQPASLGGFDLEFIFAGRIDDKLCCYAAIEALLASEDEDSPGTIKMVACFDDEEIGSLLRQGARSNLISSVVGRVCEGIAESASSTVPAGSDLFNRTMANSFLISSDVTHAVNPNFLGAYMENHAPRLNVGVAVSADSNGHMTTDSVSTALLRRVAEKCGSTLQVFQTRNDSGGGGTIGPFISSRLGCRSLDAGIPQLSMHSIRATTGSLDPGLGVKLFKGFFDCYQSIDEEFQGIP